MKQRMLFISVWILFGLLASSTLVVAQAQYYKVYFFNPGTIKQILVYTAEPSGWSPAHPGNDQYVLNIYVNPPVEGNGILTFWSHHLPAQDRQNAYFHLTQIAEQISSGAITGVAYSMTGLLSDDNPSPNFFSEILPEGQASALKAYRIRGFYFKPRSTTASAPAPAVMQVQLAPVQIPSTIPSLSGTWQSSLGYVYQIDQTGDSFTWTVASSSQRASGSIQGKHLKASWRDGQQLLNAEGDITKVDAQNRATEIRWNNGVSFFRQ